MTKTYSLVNLYVGGEIMSGENYTYSYHHPCVEVSSSGGKGMGLFATGAISKGEVVVVTGGEVIPTEALASHPLPGHPFQIEIDFLLSPPLGKKLQGIFTVNHSCDPSCGVRGQTTLVALRNLKAGDEVTFDYTMTDSSPTGLVTFEMNCLCGTALCRGKVGDLDWLIPELQHRYRGYFSAYLQQRIENQALLKNQDSMSSSFQPSCA